MRTLWLILSKKSKLFASQGSYLEENKNNFVHFDANKLTLWKVDIPILTENDKLKILNDNTESSQKIDIEQYLGVISFFIRLRKRKLGDSDEENRNRGKRKEYPPESKEGRDSLLVISGERLNMITKFVEKNRVVFCAVLHHKARLLSVRRTETISLNTTMLVYISDKEQVDEKLFGRMSNYALYFWSKVKALTSSESNKNIHILLLGAYNPTLANEVTPVKFSNSDTLSLKALLLTKEELNYGALTVEMMRYLVLSNPRSNIIIGSHAFYWIDNWNPITEEADFIHNKLLISRVRSFFPDSDPIAKNFVRTSLFAVDSGQIRFTAPIMRIVLSHHLFTTSCVKSSTYTTNFGEFLTRTIERFNPFRLSESFGRGSDANSHLFERSCQMEWYRTATTVVPVGTSISTDVSPVFGSDRFLYFYVNGELCWEIELTREGDRLKEHAERLEQDGEYADIPLKDWAIIDFRYHTKPVRDLKSNFWYIDN
ncbi:6197_t:CDS:2 [Ambispora gerdemannii]|uniref:6197_t:CDS:1 n=1 Tax=Ambispora gerdemannii TaxID=144530 RepID=A0A9N9FC28_9GLOM|nr:6197_t:CDS:2 [Ambispora gerdemannii]